MATVFWNLLKGKYVSLYFQIEIGANRYDLLCLEGLARALKIFQVSLTMDFA
jgi:hypothetical protein